MSGIGLLPPATPAIERARLRAGRVLWIEQIWPAILPAFGLVIGIMILSLLTVPQRLPVWTHALLLLAVLAGIVTLLHRRLRVLRPPARHVRDHRIEQASGLHHHPLSDLADQPVIGIAENNTRLIWQAHLQRNSVALADLSAGWPRLDLLDRNQMWRTAPLVALFVLALLLAGREAPLRIGSGLWPGLDMPLGPRPSVQAWITPPDYAGGAPIFMTNPHGHYEVAAGARFTLNLTGLSSRPSILFRGDDHGSAHPSRLSGGSWGLDRILSGSTRIEVHGAGYRLGDWTVVVQPALAPSVSWASPPGPAMDEPWHTRLPWAVSQRYGVRSLMAELRLTKPGTTARMLRVPIPLPGTPSVARGVALPDLSADPWAGETVIARLSATDTTGHAGTSADARFILPARPFRNPLARAVLDVRKRLALDRESATEAANDLQALGDVPGEFAQDSSLFLNLSTTASLLRLPARSDDQAVDRLWQLALALEDGFHNDRAGARAALEVRSAQDRLASQLEHMRQLGDKGQSLAEQSELQARIGALGAAIAQRMQALAAQAKRDHTAMPALPDQKMLSGHDLGRMLQQMRDAAAGGHPQDAARMLSQMQTLLDHMRAATPQDLQNARQQAGAHQQANDQIGEVQDLVQRQSVLLDHAQSRQNQVSQAQAGQGSPDTANMPGDGQTGMDPATQALMRQLGISAGGGPDSTAAPAAGPSLPLAPAPQSQAQRHADGHAQHVLKRALDELATEFNALTGKRAAAFDDAVRAMDRARDALAAGQDAPATAAQMQAMADLQKGAQQMRSAMSGSGSGSGTGMALLPSNGGGSDTGTEPSSEESGDPDHDSDTDPLGRHVASGHAGMDDGGETHVPENAAPARSREIEQELRRRDGDRTRPQPELDYLDRLLKSF